MTEATDLTTYERLAAEFPPEATFTDTRGGVQLTYITGEGVISRLNDVLGPGGWSFDVREHGINQDADEVWVLGRLVANLDGDRISREQFGSQKLKRSRATDSILDIGFDLKGAATDSLKKCAMGIGVGLYLSHKEAKVTAPRIQPLVPRPTPPKPAGTLAEMTKQFDADPLDTPTARFTPSIMEALDEGAGVYSQVAIPTCLCGKRKFVHKTNAQGKEWAGWMCPANPGICKPMFVDLDEAKFIEDALAELESSATPF